MPGRALGIIDQMRYRRGVDRPVASVQRRLWIACVLSAVLCAACSSQHEQFLQVSARSDAGTAQAGGKAGAGPMPDCNTVEMDGDVLVEHMKDFTARFSVGTPYTKTVMLFGGAPVLQDDTPSTFYIFGLDKHDAQMLAMSYPDFYLCSSPGGMEAKKHIVSYDFVPGSCDVYEQLVAALRTYDGNVAAGGDRTSLELQGAPLELLSVTQDSNGADATSQVMNMNFHLVTSVTQLTGQSVLAFGTSS